MAASGYEQLHRLPVYETTHPPLGKGFYHAGYCVAWHDGLYWRFAGTLFGGCWCRRPGALCAARPAASGRLLWRVCWRGLNARPKAGWRPLTLMALFSSCWGLLYAVVLPAGADVGVNGAVLPMRFWAGFGLGCASKWTGIYAGAGWRCCTQACCTPAGGRASRAFAQEFRIAFWAVSVLCGDAAMHLLASYLPYWWLDHSFGPARLLAVPGLDVQLPLHAGGDPLRLRAAGIPGCWACAWCGITAMDTCLQAEGQHCGHGRR